MRKLTLIAILLISQTSNAFWAKEVDEVGETLLYSDIEKSDLNSFKERFGRAKPSKIKGKIEKGFGHYLLGYAISRENWPQHRKEVLNFDDYICLPEFVGLILGNGALASENVHKFSTNADIKVGHLTGAINNLCEKTVNILLDVMPSDDIALASKSFSLLKFEDIKNNQKYADALIKISMALVEKNKSKCSNGNSNCDGLAHLKKELGAMKNNSKGSFLFSDVIGRPIDLKNFRSRNWDKDLKAAGIRKLRIHDARHTYASLFVMSGGSIYDLKKVLGHADVKTTERYAHLSADHLASVRDIIKPNIGSKAEIIKLGATNPPQKSERGQDEFTQESRTSVC